MKPFKTKDTTPPVNQSTSNDDQEEEEDYMKMTFTDDVPSTTRRPETSLQRRQRERREAEARGRVKSKAEIAAEEEARREAALSKSLLSTDPDAIKKNKGLSMMAKMGFTGGALGSKANKDAKAEPIKINVKDGREGIGLESERKRKLREMAEQAGEAAKKVKVDEIGYRERVRLEREEARLEGQLRGAQKIAAQMDEEMGSLEKRDDETDSAKKKAVVPNSSRPLKSLPVVYRGLVRAREEAERDRRMRHDLEQSSSSSSIGPLSSRLPVYVDDEQDDDDKMALGKDRASTIYVTADDLDEEDEELAAFEALPTAEKLAKVVMYLRERHRYCFWCKFTYPDEAMEGCPGVTEEDHD
ncbi:putative coiled-coil domain-containing protein 75 [Rhypophila decipiens]|uniref:Coiled-coil domain-containing protein 75 n=1 Tax=Rhypophila decipiens TaxID=261697 RepID=A0AAN6YHU6_9PEZI|nr:putative coiled-coil domain-containing protein 75 [Rhypophila decipiens]